MDFVSEPSIQGTNSGDNCMHFSHLAMAIWLEDLKQFLI